MDFFDGQTNDDLIRTHIENAITNKYDAILLQPEQSGGPGGPRLERRWTPGWCGDHQHHHQLQAGARSVDANPYEQAAVNARYALKKVPEGRQGRRAPRARPATSTSIERPTAWKKEFFEKRPDVTIVDNQIANWNKDEAMTLMEDWIQANGDDIGMIVAMNDNMVLGALEAYKDSRKKLTLSYGVDGTADAALAINEGRLITTCLQSAYDLGDLSVQMVRDYLTKKKTKPELVIVPNPVYTKDNVEGLLKIHRDRGLIK